MFESVTGRHGNLTEAECYELIARHGIPVVSYALAKSPQEAAQLGKTLGWPVVCKIVSPDILHKSKVGGVSLGLASEEQVIKAVESIAFRVARQAPQAAISGFLIAKQAPAGLSEAIVGGLRDVEFGPTVMFGAGGEFAEILKCVTFRPAPVSRQTAELMVESIRAKLTAHLGWRSLNTGPLADVIVNVSQLIASNPELESIDLNPVIAYEDSCLVVDSKAALQGYVRG